MNEAQLEALVQLPAPQSCWVIDFEKAEVVVLESFPPQYVLVVSGSKPYVNMKVDLIPLVYIQPPEYWGIEVVGCLPEIGLPATAPFAISLPLAGHTGKQGIEVIEVPGEEEPDVEPGPTNRRRLPGFLQPLHHLKGDRRPHRQLLPHL